MASRKKARKLTTRKPKARKKSKVKSRNKATTRKPKHEPLFPSRRPGTNGSKLKHAD